MQIINGSDFEQKNVLVGQAGETEGFGVVNDPHLMAMLSTGLYSKPHRTMVQEILFNAWDAHRMANCQDRPIDVYINDVSGLIVRDYGPGIKPKDIHGIYCMYGSSTKRNREDQTGGFGLGSKSPYAYTDSFTVTNHYDEKKYMYIMNRVSEENDGGPGRTTVINGIDTEEKGIMVTVPLKSEHDIEKTADYVRDLVQLSGMDINLHVMDNEVEELRSTTLEPGEWKISDEKSHEIWAIYGGVRYKIEEQDQFRLEYRFVKKLASILGTFYIGFKPGVLKPAPHREGLVFNDATCDAIKEQFEVIEEYFRSALIPCIRSCMKNSFMSLKESQVEPPWLATKWHRVGEHINLTKCIDVNHPVMDGARADRPSNFSKEMWNSMIEFVMKDTRQAMAMITPEKFAQMKYVIWAKNFPNHRHYKDYIMYQGTSQRSYRSVMVIEIPRTTQQIIEARDIAKAAIDADVDIRIPNQHGDDWFLANNVKGKPKTNRMSQRQQEILKDLAKDPNWVPSKKVYPDRLFHKTKGDEFLHIWMNKVIIIAKTLTALKDTNWGWQGIFSVPYAGVGKYHNFHRTEFDSSYNNQPNRPVAALIVHQRKGNYDKARKALLEAGYEVLEADAPVKVQRPKDENGVTIKPQPRAKPVYPILNIGLPDWADWDNEVENPTCYVCVTEHKIRNGYSSDRPDHELLKYVQKKTPRFVLLHNSGRAKPLERKGIPDFNEKLHSIVEKIAANPERVRQIALHYAFRHESGLPEPLLKLPEVQKFFKVPYLRTRQIESFTEEYKLLQTIDNLYRDNWVRYETRRLAKEILLGADDDPSVSLVRETSKKCELFDSREMRSYLSGMKPGEVKCFSEKLMRFLRTV